MLGPGVMIVAASHPVDYLQRQKAIVIGRSISIGDNVWVGAGTIINPGVTIGSNSVIGCGSVVVRDIPSNAVAAGNPCKIIRQIPND